MNGDDWRAVIDEYNFSGRVSRTQLQLAAKLSDHVDVNESEADRHITKAVLEGVLEVATASADVEAEPWRDDPDRALAFEVVA